MSININRGMDKEDVVHIYNRLLINHEKILNNAIYSNIDGPRDYHTKWSNLDKDKYHMILLTRGIFTAKRRGKAYSYMRVTFLYITKIELV